MQFLINHFPQVLYMHSEQIKQNKTITNPPPQKKPPQTNNQINPELNKRDIDIIINAASVLDIHDLLIKLVPEFFYLKVLKFFNLFYSLITETFANRCDMKYIKMSLVSRCRHI